MTASQSTAADAPRGTIYLWPDSLLLAGHLPANRTHRHVPASLLCSLDNPFALEVDGQWRHTRAALVAPEVPQALDPEGNRMLVIHLEPDALSWRALRPLLDGRSNCDLDAVASEPYAGLLDGVSGRTARLLLQELLAGFSTLAAAPPDQRIVRAANLLREDLPDRLDVNVLAEQIGLSASRLRHLFREQTDVTLKRFLLHLKMRKVFSHWRPGISLTELAGEAGFYDQPHLTRAARDMYDALPSAYIAAGSFSIVKD